MGKILVSVLTVSALCALTASAQVPVPAASAGGGVEASGSQNWVFGTEACYVNDVNLLGFLINAAEAEWGDGLTLAGPDRCVNSVTIAIHANDAAGFTADTTVRFFEDGNTLRANFPGAEIWASDVVPAMTINGFYDVYTFPVEPAVQVPADGKFTWTIQLANVVGNTAEAVGPRYAGPPTAGGSENWTWRHDGPGAWTSFAFTELGEENSYAATVLCEPCGDCDPCDMNCDGDINAFDIEPFLDLLFGPGPPCNTCTGDVNGDGVIDAFDIEPFLECLFP